MQDCFREHPEMYGSELEGDEEEVEEELRSRDSIKESGEAPAKSTAQNTSNAETGSATAASTPKPAEEAHRDSRSTTAEKAQTLGDEGGELVPRAAHDATSK